MIETRVHGSVESGFESVRQAFAANFERHGDVGAACCVYAEGRKVVDLWGGTYAPETLQMVMSSTKGVETGGTDGSVSFAGVEAGGRFFSSTLVSFTLSFYSEAPAPRCPHFQLGSASRAGFCVRLTVSPVSIRAE